MIDTLMVLWTRGVLARFLRFMLLFSLLLTGICLALFLATMSGVKWPGLAFNTGSPGISQASADSSLSPVPVVTPGKAAIVIPEILHNPTPTAIPPTPTPIQAVNETRPAPTIITRPVPDHRYHAPSSVPAATPLPAQAPTAQPTINDDTQPWFSNAISANGRLAGSLIGPGSMPTLKSLFWAALLASTLMALGGLGLIAFTRRRKGQPDL